MELSVVTGPRLDVRSTSRPGILLGDNQPSLETLLLVSLTW